MKAKYALKVRIPKSSNLCELLASLAEHGKQGDAICVLKALAIVGKRVGFSPAPKRTKIPRVKGAALYRIHTYDCMTFEEVIGYAEKAWEKLNANSPVVQPAFDPASERAKSAASDRKPAAQASGKKKPRGMGIG